MPIACSPLLYFTFRERQIHGGDIAASRIRVKRPSLIAHNRLKAILLPGPRVKSADLLARFYALGRTARFRLLFLVFTVRKKQIRVISARDMTRREKAVYESIAEKNSEI